jgi:alpha-1,3-mannosyltransferase
MYSQGLGKILAVPSVNVAYSDNEATETKHIRGYVGDHINTSSQKLNEYEVVQWQTAPPDMIKCLAHSDQLAWTEWTEST